MSTVVKPKKERSEDVQLSERMLDYWTNFMKKGDPNGNGLPQWRECSAADPFVMEFDV